MVAEQDILSFCDITGASTEVAEQFIEIADGSVETAVTLYLENGENTTNAIPNPDATTSNLTENDWQNFNNDQLIADEETARRLQESSDVRAPIAPRHDILAGDSTEMFTPHFNWVETGEERHATSRPSVFNQGDSTTGSISNIFDTTRDAQSSSSAAENLTASAVGSNTPKAKRLADLFRPPFDIMFHGNFEQARIKAQKQEKWIMINIINPTEFACQVLNRDLWSDTVYGYESRDGIRYANYYPVKSYPHTSIIDCRTGERVKIWEKQTSPADFTTELTEFIENNSSEKASQNSTKRPKTVSDLSEEDQLKAAIAASLSSDSSPSPEEPVEDIKESIFDSIQPVERQEPENGNSTTRIQIRMGDGSRIVRRFSKSDPVRYLFEFIKTKLEGKQFELVFNRAQLIEVLDQTISDAGLSNAAVNCTLT